MSTISSPRAGSRPTPATAGHGRMHGPRQLTDLYLLALAVEHKGRFITFDAQIPLSAVRGATARHLVSI